MSEIFLNKIEVQRLSRNGVHCKFMTVENEIPRTGKDIVPTSVEIQRSS